MLRSDERGVAVIMALLMVLLVSALSSAMIVVARTEALSSLSYTAMSQVRYGAESGVHAATNYLLFTYQSPGSVVDPIASYDLTASPVTVIASGDPVVLSSDPAVPSTYPVEDVRDAFLAASQGTLDVSGADVGYNAIATLVSMRQITDSYSGLPVTIQTWEVTGTGQVAGAGAALVEVSATIERQPVPVFKYAAFATHDGCDALSFAGGATTQSYDSGAPLVGGNPVISNSDGNVGTNGNLNGNGGPTTLYGTLSTPRAGVGNCTTNNVTAATISGWATVEEGLVTLPQPVVLPTPEPLDPLPPTTATSFGAGACPAMSPAVCTKSGSEFIITPASASSVVTMGNVELNANRTVHLNAGIYEINSLMLNGNATIVIDSGPVIFKVAGVGETTPISLSGGGVSNPSLDPTDLTFIYGGTGEVKITGGADTAALIYAPNATASLSSAVANFYGAIVTKKVTATGGFNLFYDRRLANTAMTSGNPTMSAFTWRTF